MLSKLEKCSLSLISGFIYLFIHLFLFLFYLFIYIFLFDKQFTY